jgi:hypothetical protein
MHTHSLSLSLSLSLILAVSSLVVSTGWLFAVLSHDTVPCRLHVRWCRGMAATLSASTRSRSVCHDRRLPALFQWSSDTHLKIVPATIS